MISEVVNNSWWSSQESIIFPLFAGSCTPRNCSVYKSNLALIKNECFFNVILFCRNDINVYYVVWKILGVSDSFLLCRTILCIIKYLRILGPHSVNVIVIIKKCHSDFHGGSNDPLRTTGLLEEDMLISKVYWVR